VAGQNEIARIVGEFSHLKEEEHWPDAIANMVESIAWQTQSVLGVSKSQLIKRIVNETLQVVDDDVDRDKIGRQVVEHIKREVADNTVSDRAPRPTGTGLISPYEAHRRMRFHSEDFLNREFDILWSLVGDDYLDTFYGQFTDVAPDGKWVTHGNTTRLLNSLGCYDMQFDSLSYNYDRKLLVANELKLGGGKNRDQVLKYSHLFRSLRRNGYIECDDETMLLFIGRTIIDHDQVQYVIRKEIDYLDANPKKWFTADRDGIVRDAQSMKIYSTTWRELWGFNTVYARERAKDQQTLQKLLIGFNDSLAQKPLLQIS